MNFPNAIFTLLWVAAFVAVVVMAVKGLRTTLVPRDDSAWTPPGILRKKKRGGTGPPQRKRDQRPQKRARRARRRDQRTDLLPPDATISFAAEREAADIDDVFAALDNDLVGLVPVKKKVQEIAALLLVDRARQRFGLDAPRPNLHMCFTGPPGTGKTTVALRMADLLHRLGYLEEGQLVHAMRDDLVGEYIGQTAPRTRRMLDRAMGGVLFIDE